MMEGVWELTDDERVIQKVEEGIAQRIQNLEEKAKNSVFAAELKEDIRVLKTIAGRDRIM